MMAAIGVPGGVGVPMMRFHSVGSAPHPIGGTHDG
jgi:hypothetical protein